MNALYEAHIRELMQDERVVVLTAENRAALRSFKPGIENRFIDTGITEQTLIGAAAGLALQGRRPVTHALAAFLTMRAFEFIRTDVGIGGLPVTLVGYIPGVLSEANGPTHQALEDISLMRHIPGMAIFCPADGEELVAGLQDAIFRDGPTYIRYNNQPAPYPHSPFRWGKAEQIGVGDEIALLVYGALTTQAWKAYKELERRGHRVRLLNLRTLVPLDEQAVDDAVDHCRLVVTIEDHFVPGGLYSLLAERLLQRGVTTEVLGIGFHQRWFRPALLPEVLRVEGLEGLQLADRIQSHYRQRRLHGDA